MLIPLGILAASGAGGGGSFESIASVTATGATATFNFTSIPSTYRHLQIRGISKANAYNANARLAIKMYFNDDTSSTNYYHTLDGDGSTATAAGSSQSYLLVYGGLIDTANSNTNTYGAMILDIHDYASTTKNKTVRYFAGTDKNLSNSAYRVWLGSTLWATTSAITKITLTGEVDFGAGTTFALYGIKGA